MYKGATNSNNTFVIYLDHEVIADKIPDPFHAHYLLDCLKKYPPEFYVYDPEYPFDEQEYFLFGNPKEAIEYAEINDLAFATQTQVELLQMRPHYLNIYLVDRAYGGPEEGGWWYDHGTVHRSIKAPNYQSAKRHHIWVSKIAEQMNEGLPPISSVLSRGQYLVRLEIHPGEPFPTTIPRYE